MKRREVDFRCGDCGVDTLQIAEYYHVWPRVWIKYVGVRDGPGAVMLCIGCLEARMGRQLHWSDFSEAPCNTSEQQSERLRDRMSGGKDSVP